MSANVDPAPILDLIEAFRRSKTMFTALEMGVFDRLAGGPLDAAALATEAGADTMARLLDACCSLGLLRKEGDRYANTEVAQVYLCRKSPWALVGYIEYSNRVLYSMWANLPDAIREGTHRWRQTFGGESSEIFNHFYKTEEAMRGFLDGMHCYGLLSSPAVLQAFDLSGFRHLIDLGGGTGHLAASAAELYPNMRTTVFDLERVVDYARERCAGTRVEFVIGDFFNDPLPPADLYAVGRILHDWTVEKIRVLLKKIYAALPPGGALLIAERLLNDDLMGPVPTHMQSLNMLICCEGRERSVPQYRELLQDAGFATVDGKKTGTTLDAVLARKA